MNATAEGLWARVRAEIGRRGLLPLRSEPLTPREIAEHLREQDGDRTVQRFVHDYYYPATFGQTLGSMSEREAEVLVAAFEAGRTSADAAGTAPPGAPTCRLCNRRPVPRSSE